MTGISPELLEPIERKAVYAGSFDPPTNGHLWVIEEGAEFFDQLHVAVAINPEKRNTFSMEERVEMLEEISRPFPNVTVGSFVNRYTVHYAKDIGARYLLRGLRDGVDYGAEQKIFYTNRRLDPEIQTWMISCPPELTHVSSSFIKGMVGPEHWKEAVSEYVSESVLNALERDLENRRAAQ